MVPCEIWTKSFCSSLPSKCSHSDMALIAVKEEIMEYVNAAGSDASFAEMAKAVPRFSYSSFYFCVCARNMWTNELHPKPWTAKVIHGNTGQPGETQDSQVKEGLLGDVLGNLAMTDGCHDCKYTLGQQDIMQSITVRYLLRLSPDPPEEMMY